MRAVGGAIQDVIDKTSRIADGAARIGTSAEAFQRLSFAAAQSGGSMTAIETAMRVMSDRIVDGKLPKALTDMGVSLESLQAMTPDQAFLTIADALQRMPEGFTQTSAAVDIFGRGAQQLLPAIKSGFDDVAAAAPVMSNAMVQSADQVGDRWLEMQTKIDNLKAQALLPLIDGFLKLPESVQIATAGFATFLPALEPLMLALIAFGGPAGVLAGLKTAASGVGLFFSGTLPGLFAGAITFFTTTLPAAFGAVIAFLGPQGLIALAVLALALIWYKWGDDIAAFTKKWAGIIGGWFLDVKNKAVAYSQQLFEGVKAWLIDKFNAIVDSIKQKAGMVTGFFKDMYMKVVGGSIVPDMIRGIGAEFGKLSGAMVNPTASATSAVAGLFASMLDVVGRAIDGLIGRIPGIGGALSGVLEMMGGAGNVLTDLLGRIPGLGDLWGGAGVGGSGGGLLGGMLGSGGLLGGLGGGGAAGGTTAGTGAMAGLMTNPLTGIAAGAAMWAMGAFSGSTFKPETLDQLGSYHDATGQSAMYGMMFDRENVRKFHSGGMVPGTGQMPAMLLGGERVLSRSEADEYDRGGGVSVSIANVTTPDAASFVRDLPRMVKRNAYGLRSGLREALGTT